MNSAFAVSRWPGLAAPLAGFEMAGRTAQSDRRPGSVWGTAGAVACGRVLRSHGRPADGGTGRRFLSPAHADREQRDEAQSAPRQAATCSRHRRQRYSSIRLDRRVKSLRALPRRIDADTRSARPARLDEDLLRFAEVPRGRRDDRLLADEQLPSRPQRRPDIVFADELCRVIGCERSVTRCRSWRSSSRAHRRAA